MSASEETLTLISIDRWSSLIDLFKGPDKSAARSVIKLQIINKQQNADFPVRIFAPYNKPEDGIICIWNWSGSGSHISIYPTKDDQTKLIDAMKNTKVIDWSKSWTFCATRSDVQFGIMEVLDHLKINKYMFHTRLATLSRDEALKFDAKPSPDIRLQTVGLEYAEEIDEAWAIRYSGSLSYFKTLLKQGAGLGIFGAVDGDIRGWILRSARGELHHLYIKKEHRRKGYAQLLVRILSKMNAENDLDIHCCLSKENTASIELFSNIGFDINDEVAWIVN